MRSDTKRGHCVLKSRASILSFELIQKLSQGEADNMESEHVTRSCGTSVQEGQYVAWTEPCTEPGGGRSGVRKHRAAYDEGEVGLEEERCVGIAVSALVTGGRGRRRRRVWWECEDC